MKGPNFTLDLVANLLKSGFNTMTRAFSIVVTTLVFGVTVHAQTVDCNVIMACNDGVQISLDEDCSMYIEPDMILEAPAYTDEYYDVEAKLANGQPLPVEVVGQDFLGRDIRRVLLDGGHVGLTIHVKVTLRGCGNSCWGYASIEDKLAPVLETLPCEERITRLSDTISIEDDAYDRPLSDDPTLCGISGTTNGVRYETHTFAVDVTGDIDITLPDVALRFSLYAGPFNPASPCDNLIATDLNAYVGTLSTGTNYTLVVSSTGSATPPFGFDYTIFIDNESGTVKSSVDATICMVPCTGEAALLNQTAANAPQRPVFYDGCSTNLMFTKYDVVYPQTCADKYAKIIVRVWTAKDPSGNISEEVRQYFYIKRGSLDDVTCPADWNGNCSVNYTRLPNGAPAPSVSGQPTNISCQNIQVFYDDIVFDLCGAGIKVLRRWTILDWCTGEEKVCAQTLKIDDTAKPSFTCPTLPNLPSAVDKCGADWVVTPPSATDCSFVTWEVSFSKDGVDLPVAPVNAVFLTSEGITGGTTVVGNIPGFSNGINQTARPYTIRNLPLGKTWIKYRVVDECDNVMECITSITVIDNVPPTAICEDQTVISLDDSGWGELYAESLDNHSLDNCGPIELFEVRRKQTFCPGYEQNLQFGSKVSFCCNDITSPASYVTVVLRVYDAVGNFNECETTVKVQNKRPPVITCPANKTLVCGDSRIAPWVAANQPFDTLFFGVPTVSGVCANLQFGSRILSSTIDAKCGTGTVVREWFLISNPTIRCQQRLTINSPVFSAANVTFPGTLVLNTCDITKAHPDITGSKPEVTGTGCREVGISFEDQIFYNAPEACIKILRTWRVIDWCSYPTSPVVVERVQTVMLSGSAGAVITGCANQTITTDPGRCDKDVTLTVNATDECTLPQDLIYDWTLDLFKNNTVDESGSGKTAIRTLPAGTHKVTFNVTNRCNIVKTCMYDITIRPTKKPTPVCIRELVWVLDSDGTTEVWASDFNLKSENNCGDDTKLKFSFNSQGTQPGKSFTCADIPNGQVARIPLQMFVIDEFGNFDFCDVILILQDSPLNNKCTDKANLLPSVSGRITTEMKEGIDNIEVSMINMNNTSDVAKAMTHDQGSYHFQGVSVFDPKSIGAFSNSDFLNGVSTLDLVLVQRHILGLQTLDSPYKLLAADVNNSRSITASDLTNLRKAILGVVGQFENNTSWRFLPEDFTFTDPKYPFDFPSKINLDSVFEDRANVNFMAVKVGDINNSAKANATSIATEKRSNPSLLTYDPVSFAAGETVKISIRSTEDTEIIGAQLALRFPAEKMQLTDVIPGLWSASKEHYTVKGDVIRISYDIAGGQKIGEDDVLFTLVFTTSFKGAADEITLAGDVMQAEIYDVDAAIRIVSLQAREEGQTIVTTLYQNEPNPFKETTIIPFELANSSAVTLRILDINGKQVFVQSGSLDKGYHTITLSNAQIGGSGVYYYQLEAAGFTATRKMILIE